MIQNIMILEEDNPFGLVGREEELEDLQDFYDSDQSVILVHGPTGIGKTSLIRQFMKRNIEIEPDNHQTFWFSFPNVRTIEFIFNCLAAHTSKQEFFSLPLAEKVDLLAYVLSIRPCTIIIDNFEQSCGDASGSISPIIPDEEMELLKSLFIKMNGGESKFILISSEHPAFFDFDDDLDFYEYFIIDPLDSIASQTLAERIFQFYDIHSDVGHKDIERLLKIIDGHPLSMQILLSRLQYQSPEMLIAKYHAHRHTVMQIGNLRSGDYDTHLMALIHLVVSDLPVHVNYILPALAFYEGSLETGLLQAVINIYQTSSLGFSASSAVNSMVQELINFLEHNRFIAKYIPGTENYQIMPLLTEYSRRIALRCEPQNIKNDWAGAFVHVVARLASNLKGMDNFGKQLWYHFNNATFHRAYEEACKHQMHDHSGVLLQIIAAFARVNRNYAKAERCFTELVGIHHALEDPQMKGITLFQLAHIAEDQRQFKKAQIWLQKALSIFEDSNRDYEAASVRHQLGRIAHQKGDLELARLWLKQALNTFNKIEASYEAADISLQLGRINHEQNNLKQAEKWYQRAIDIFEIYEDEYRSATIYQQLGNIANDKRDFDISEQWFNKAIKIYEKLGMDRNLISIYQKTAQAAQSQRNFKAAEKWYAKVFGLIKDENKSDHLALLYKSIGKMAQEQGEYSRAEKLYQISHSIYEQQADTEDSFLADLFFEMSILDGLKGEFENSGRNIIKSIMSLNLLKSNDEIECRINNFKLSYWQAPVEEKIRLRKYWEENVGEFPIKE